MKYGVYLCLPPLLSLITLPCMSSLSPLPSFCVSLQVGVPVEVDGVGVEDGHVGFGGQRVVPRAIRVIQ